MINALRKVIEKFILPQFPWVKSYRLEPTEWEDHIYGITVVYIPELDDDGLMTVSGGLAEIEELTETMFKMIGDGGKKYQLFSVRFDIF